MEPEQIVQCMQKSIQTKRRKSQH